MKIKILTYSSLIYIHIALGFLLFLSSKISFLYGLLIFFLGFIILTLTKNNKNQTLYIAAYIVGSEVLLRMTGGSSLYEMAKYSVIALMIYGMFFSGFSMKSFPYWIFFIVLIPGILLATVTLNLNLNIRKEIAFNISGPFCLFICTIYCYQRRITLKELDNILVCLLMPIISTVTYMILYMPSVKEIITDTNSNFSTSGGFGPNQVSTILGLGLFIVFTRLLFYSKGWINFMINLFILSIIAFRGIITFSRGGMIASVVMILLLLSILYLVLKKSAASKIVNITIFSFIVFLVIWSFSSNQTSGLINKRYANQDAAGRIKESRLSGREQIMEGEFKMFLDNPILGVGVGKARDIRLEEEGGIASHNEITRMLAEHGSFGILGLLILLFTPLVLYVNNKKHIYLLPLYAFWLLTINHAAMRLAAPAFIYALTLLQVYNIEKPKENDDVKIEQ
jgi:O-antigen ligase